jgi:hypothetical protein
MTDKLYYAKDLTVWKSPVREQVEGSHRVSVGFPVCTVSEYIGQEGAVAVAELLILGEASQNETEATPTVPLDLLEAIDRKAEAGLCYYSLTSARAFLEDIRALVSSHRASKEETSPKEQAPSEVPPTDDEVRTLIEEIPAKEATNV